MKTAPPICSLHDPDGLRVYACTLPLGHQGRHAAHGLDRKLLASWPRSYESECRAEQDRADCAEWATAVRASEDAGRRARMRVVK